MRPWRRAIGCRDPPQSRGRRHAFPWGEKERTADRAKVNEQTRLRGRCEEQIFGGGGDGVPRAPGGAVALAEAVNNRQSQLFRQAIGQVGPCRAEFGDGTGRFQQAERERIAQRQVGAGERLSRGMDRRLGDVADRVVRDVDVRSGRRFANGVPHRGWKRDAQGGEHDRLHVQADSLDPNGRRIDAFESRPDRQSDQCTRHNNRGPGIGDRDRISGIGYLLIVTVIRYPKPSTRNFGDAPLQILRRAGSVSDRSADQLARLNSSHSC